MPYLNKIKRVLINNKLLLENIDKYIAIIGIFASIILIVYLSYNINRIMYVLTGIFSLAFCTLWLLYRKKVSMYLKSIDNHSLFLALFSIYFLLLALSVLSIYINENIYERPLIYFVITSFMAGIIFFEIIFSSEKHNYMIIIQIILLGLNISLSQLLLFPGMIGVDPWWHQAFTERIINSNHIPVGFAYSDLPIFHLLIGSTSILSNLNFKFSMIFSVIFLQLFCNVIFIYLIAKFLFNNIKVSLLAPLLLIIANYHICMSYWPIPNQIAAVLIPIILYMLIKRKDNTFYYILLALFMLTSILTHTITALCISIVLFVAWVSSKFYIIISQTKNNFISIYIPILYFISMLAWWTYSSRNLVNEFVNIAGGGFSTEFFFPGYSQVSMIIRNIVPLQEEIFNNLGFFLFIALSILGIFYMISRKGNNNSFILALITVTPVSIAFFSLISGHTILEDRWWYISQILLCIPLAVTFILIVNINKNIYKNTFLCFIFIVILSFLMIISPQANIDNHFFSPNSGFTASLKSSELASVKTLSNSLMYYSMYTDDYFTVTSNLGYDVKSYSGQLFIKDFSSIPQKSIILVRRDTLTKPFKMFNSLFMLNFDFENLLNNDYNKIYDSSSMIGYN